MIDTIVISCFALIVALISLWFSIRSWQETNRPLITARIYPNISGDITTPLDIIVENTGNRPARNIRLTAKKQNLINVLHEKHNKNIPEFIEYIFFDKDVYIPVLANGKKVSSGFGYIGKNDSIWNIWSTLPTTVEYQDLDGRKFKNDFNLLIGDVTGFAGTFWGGK